MTRAGDDNVFVRCGSRDLFVLLVVRACWAGLIFWLWDRAVEGDGSPLS